MNRVVLDEDVLIRNDYPSIIQVTDYEIFITKQEKFALSFEILNNFQKHSLKVDKNLTGNMLIMISAKNNSKVDLRIEILENSHVSLTILYLSNQNSFFNLQVQMKQDSSAVIGEFFLSTGISKHQNTYNLVGQNAQIHNQFVGISADGANQQLDILFNHRAKNTVGDTNGVAIAKDSGLLIVNTKSQIDQGMSGSNAFQKVRGVILSDSATLEINPILLIDEYDVKAGHGATIGKIEEELLFYLMSRGITSANAEKMIINAFMNPILDLITDVVFKEKVVSIIEARL